MDFNSYKSTFISYGQVRKESTNSSNIYSESRCSSVEMSKEVFYDGKSLTIPLQLGCKSANNLNIRVPEGINVNIEKYEPQRLVESTQGSYLGEAISSPTLVLTSEAISSSIK